MWRGATVSAAVRPDGVSVRNRWRRVLVPFGEITAIEVRQSVTYGILGVGLSVWHLFGPSYQALDVDGLVGETHLLMIGRRGHRRRLPLSATLGMARHPDEMAPFLEALAAHGHRAELPGPTWRAGPLDRASTRGQTMTQL